MAAEEMLSFLDRVIEAMSDAVLVVNTAGTVVAVNQAALNLLDLADRASALRPFAEYDRNIAAWHLGETDFTLAELRRSLRVEAILRRRATVTTAKGREHVIEFPPRPFGILEGK